MGRTDVGNYAVVAQGTALVFASVVMWGMGGLFMRLLSLDLWTIVFWRGVQRPVKPRQREHPLFPPCSAGGWRDALIRRVGMRRLFTPAIFETSFGVEARGLGNMQKTDLSLGVVGTTGSG